MVGRQGQLYNLTGGAPTLETLIREELEDPATDSSGNSVPAAQRRFQSSDIAVRIALTNVFVGQKLGVMNPGDNVVYADGTYAANAVSAAYPSGPGRADPVFKVEDITAPTTPRVIEFVGLHDIEHYQPALFDGITIPRTNYRCAFAASGTTPHIVIRPRPATDLAIRVWYIAPPITYSDNEQNQWSAQWAELLVLHTAKALASRSGEFQQQQQERLDALWDLFMSSGSRQRSRERVRRRRTGWS